MPQRKKKKPVKKAKKKAVEQKKRRRSTEAAPSLGNHVLFLFAGMDHPRELVTGLADVLSLHTKLLPAATIEVLEQAARPHGFYIIEDAKEIVQLYRSYVYTGKLYTICDDQQDEWGWLADSYLLGLSLKDERFCNIVIDGMIEKQIETGEYPTYIASAVFAQTQAGDKLRRLVVDMHVWAGQGEGVRHGEDDANGPAAFHRSMAVSLRGAGKQVYDPKIKCPWELNRCQYHEHSVTEPCVAG